MAAAGAQHQVQLQEKHEQLLPHQRSPAPVSTPIVMSSSSIQAARSHPNSHAGAEVPQSGSSLTGPGISCSGSALSYQVSVYHMAPILNLIWIIVIMIHLCRKIT